MTVESLSAHIRPPELSELKMFDCREENNSARDSSFHDYARPNNNTKSNKIMNIHNMISQPLVIIPDHSLAMDSGTSAYSPGGGLMYEADPMDSTRALLSPSASEAQPSPMSSFRKDSLETLYQLEEESIDLTACTNNSYWGQIDGPPIQDYLADISSDTDWYQLVRLVDSPNEFEMKTAAVRDKNSDNLNSAPLQMGLKNEDSPGPTLAQLNDKDCVLDRKPLMGLTCQSWSSLAGGNIAQQEGGSSTNVTAGWKSACPVSVSVPTPVISQMNPVVSAAAPLGSATLVNSKGVRPLQSDVQSDIKSTSLASLLSVNMSSDSALSMTANGTRQRQNPFMGVLPADPPSQSTHAGNLQELLGLVTEVVQATDQKPASELPKNSNKFATTGGKWKNSDASGGTSMERKWEEIRKYIDSNTKLEEGMLADEAKQSAKHRETVKRAQEQSITEKELPAKKFKVEVQEVSDVSPEDDDDDSDYGNSDDDFSEIDSDCSYSSFIEDLRSGNKKEKRYFWQYNTQSKGPKGKRLCKSMQERDPHCLADFEDPVFQPDCQDARYKHNGKARKGDGNDITPSPLKLFQIGNELLKLNKKINSIGVNIPVKTKDGVKSKSRREKNKFASRACRLKKKAQHEANKLKLFGLEEEHRQLMDVLRDIKREISFRVKMGKIIEAGGFVQLYEKIIKTNLTVMVAGNTADYVNTVLERVASGDKTGGILLHRHGIQ